jgi:hypothetical protein
MSIIENKSLIAAFNRTMPHIHRNMQVFTLTGTIVLLIDHRESETKYSSTIAIVDDFKHKIPPDTVTNNFRDSKYRMYFIVLSDSHVWEGWLYLTADKCGYHHSLGLFSKGEQRNKRSIQFDQHRRCSTRPVYP